jgi:hypothetical protein
LAKKYKYTRLFQKNKTIKELVMNLYTLLGVALADEEFGELFFDNPLEAARSLGLVLSKAELDTLEAIVATDGLEKHFGAVRTRVCPNPPCAWSLARECKPRVGVSSAAD